VSHAHDHDHSALGHVHGFGGDRGARALLIALILNGVYTLIEAVVGFTSRSLALVAEVDPLSSTEGSPLNARVRSGTRNSTSCRAGTVDASKQADDTVGMSATTT
jgi:hypothetical protein